MYFPVNFAKFLRTPFLQNTSVDIKNCSCKKRLISKLVLKYEDER